MEKYIYYFNRAKQLPLKVLLLKILNLLQSKIKIYYEYVNSLFVPTFSKSVSNSDKNNYLQIFSAPKMDDILKYFPEIVELNEKYMAHKFDLLGSGWTYISTPGNKNEEINLANKKKSDYIKNNLISSDYKEIDWQLDFKSGYRWSSKTFFNFIKYGHQKGVDVKVPWELARMHHLVHLSYGYAISKDSNLQEAQKYLEEFKDQILDFIANNPPKFGVNWKCPMDISIRAANWLVSLDFFHNYGAEFDSEFYITLENSLIDHGRHVLDHLEISGGFRGNHYLADIAGVHFIANYLAKNNEAKAWLDITEKALDEERVFQFNPEGSNFEGSTSYHRLSSEMLLYSTMISLARGRECFSDQYLETLSRSAIFSSVVTKKTGEIVQVGDCDSGRFLKLSPSFHEKTLNEIHLNHDHYIWGCKGLFNYKKEIECSKMGYLEYIIVNNTVNKKIEASLDNNTSIQSDTSNKDDFFSMYDSASLDQKKEYVIELKGLNTENIQLYSYKDFGLYIYKSDDFFMSIRCGAIGQAGNGGHDHNDQLSIELQFKGKDLIVDPGTYIYTPYPESRNLYRSVKSHFAPQIDKEPCPLNQGLFSLNGSHGGEVLMVNETEFLGFHNAYEDKIYRYIKIQNDKVTIYDLYTGEESLVELVLNQDSEYMFPQIKFSQGYGLLR